MVDGTARRIICAKLNVAKTQIIHGLIRDYCSARSMKNKWTRYKRDYCKICVAKKQEIQTVKYVLNKCPCLQSHLMNCLENHRRIDLGDISEIPLEDVVGFRKDLRWLKVRVWPKSLFYTVLFLTVLFLTILPSPIFLYKY